MKIKIGLKDLSLSQFAALAGGASRFTAEEAEQKVLSLCTDSREAEAGSVFLAIRGERVDGNDYAESALSKGAVAVLGERLPENGPAILVEDTVKAIGKLARRIKAFSGGFETVAVTGSVGKTTTKDMLYAVLASHFTVHRSEGNYNSEIGMPLSMLATPEGSELAVLEMGMGARGEISYLSRIAEPSLAVITNVGSAHLEALGTRENIYKAKLEILDGMYPGGRVLLNLDDDFLPSALPLVKARGLAPFTVSRKDPKADFYAANIRLNSAESIFDLHYNGRIYRDLRIPLMGAHQVYAALFASAVGLLYGIPEEEIRLSLSRFRPGHLRQSVLRVGAFTLVEDCYNASPESMRASISVAEQMAKEKNGRLVLLLGDMRELGSEEEALHRTVGQYAALHGADLLFTFGPLSSSALKEGAGEGGMPEEAIFSNPDPDRPDKTFSALKAALLPGDILLVKASRALRAERITEALKNDANFLN